jgi:hypothetical protein
MWAQLVIARLSVVYSPDCSPPSQVQDDGGAESLPLKGRTLPERHVKPRHKGSASSRIGQNGDVTRNLSSRVFSGRAPRQTEEEGGSGRYVERMLTWMIRLMSSMKGLQRLYPPEPLL